MTAGSSGAPTMASGLAATAATDPTSRPPPTPALAIVGPTATGKSALAMALARTVPGVELIAVDALQVYRGMDIGTAKPTAAERAEIPHHGLDLAEPAEVVTLVGYQAAADAALAGIAARGHRAVLVAGTGLYLRAVLDRLSPPGQWPALRAELEAVTDARALHRRLATLDPAAAAKIDPANHRRTVRALEVCLGSGRPYSSFGPGLEAYPPRATVQIGLRWPRAVLASRITDRFHAMLDAGLLAEVAALRARPGARPGPSADAVSSAAPGAPSARPDGVSAPPDGRSRPRPGASSATAPPDGRSRPRPGASSATAPPNGRSRPRPGASSATAPPNGLSPAAPPNGLSAAAPPAGLSAAAPPNGLSAAAPPAGLSATARQALGYAELLDHLDGRCSLEAAVERAIARTRRFATRQERWFRRDPRIRWVDVDGDPLCALPAALEALGAVPACV